MAGSIIKGFWNDVEYNVKATTDIDQTSGAEVEGIKHTGGTLFKDEQQAETIGTIDLICDAAAEIALRADEKNKVIAAFGVKEGDGRLKTGTGRINLGSYNSMEETLQVTFIADGEILITPP